METLLASYAEESFSDVKVDIRPLLESHWSESGTHQDKIEVDPDWKAYELAYIHGFLKIYTARKNDSLIGYCIVNVVPNLHSKNNITASCDLIYVLPEMRKGMIGYKLIQFAEADLKDKGVSVFNISTRVDAPFDSLMQRMKYNLVERSYSKYIG